MRKKLNRTSVIILIVAALTVAVPSLVAYSYYDRARKSEELLPAIYSNNTAKAIMLLKSGADPNYMVPHDDMAVTAIKIACERRNVAVVKELLSRGVKPWLIGQDKASLIQRTLMYTGNASPQACNEIMQMLIERGADVNAVNPNDPSPIFIATASGQNAAVRFLVDHGANLNVTIRGVGSPLDAATGFGNTFAVRLLLNAGADPSKCGTTFEQLIAVKHNHDHDEIVAILKAAMAKRKSAGSGGLKK